MEQARLNIREDGNTEVLKAEICRGHGAAEKGAWEGLELEVHAEDVWKHFRLFSHCDLE